MDSRQAHVAPYRTSWVATAGFGLFCLAAALSPVGAHAQSLRPEGAIELRQPLRDRPGSATAGDGSRSDQPTAVQWYASTGLMQIREQGGRNVWSMPFEIDAYWKRDTIFRIVSDGLGRASVDGKQSRGFNDVTLSGLRVVQRDADSRVRLGIGVTVPGSKEFSSAGVRHFVSASYTRYFGERWAGVLYTGVKRFDKSPLDSAGRIEETARLQAIYYFDTKFRSRAVVHNASIELQRSHRVGVVGLTQWTFAYDMPLTSNSGLGVHVTRGTTPGLRDTTIGIDLIVAF